jgi:hypothetical protein
LLGLSTGLLGHATIARAQSFTVFDAPNTNITEVRMINDRGDVVGVLFDSTQREPHKSGFFVWVRIRARCCGALKTALKAGKVTGPFHLREKV